MRTENKILLIEDEPDISKITEFRLKQAGFNVLLAKDGQEGWDMVNKERPNLVLLDLNIPKLNGEEVCRRIKSEPSLRGIPVILLTASTEEVESAALSANADGYILKPYETQEFLAKVRAFCGNN